MKASGNGHGGGLTFSRLHRSVARDSYSDFLPMVSWNEENQAFLCIDDGWGQAWELVPSAYLFAHVHQALIGLLNIQFAPGTVVQILSFADPLVDPSLDQYLNLKTRSDPLVQMAAHRAARYLREGTAGLDALHGIPIRNFRVILAIKTRKPLGSDLRRQIEEQLSKLGIARLSPQAVVSFYRRIFNGVFADAPGMFDEGSPTVAARPVRKESGRALPYAQGTGAAHQRRAGEPLPGRDARRFGRQRPDWRPVPLHAQHPVRSLGLRNPQARPDPLCPEGRRKLRGRGRQADRGNRLGSGRGGQFAVRDGSSLGLAVRP
jgi:hypothetical protein